jgi:hypothetical protein
MKSFFKKIGKELKRGFQKIGKFMNSKIGRIMGGILLAWNIGSIFASLYKGIAGAATQTAATGAAVDLSGQVVAESGKVAASLADQAVQGAGKALTKTVTESALRETTGQVVISSLDDLAAVGTNLAANSAATNVVSGSIAENSAKLVEELKANRLETLTQQKAPSSVSTKTVVDQTAAAVGDAGVPVLDAAVPKVNVAFDNPDQLTEVFSGTFDDAANAKLDLLKPITKLPTKTIEGQALSSTQMNQQIAWANSTPAARTEFLANKANRALYETNFQNLTSTFKAPVEYGSTEFSSLGNAFKGGKNLLESTANVGKQIMDTSIGEVTGGRVGGFLGRQSAAGTAYTGVTTAASLLAEPPEEPFTPNYQARSIAQQLGQSSEAISMQPLSQGPADMYTQMDWSSPDYFKQLMSINNNAGMSYAYGGGGMNAGRYG